MLLPFGGVALGGVPDQSLVNNLQSKRGHSLLAKKGDSKEIISPVQRVGAQVQSRNWDICGGVRKVCGSSLSASCSHQHAEFQGTIHE